MRGAGGSRCAFWGGIRLFGEEGAVRRWEGLWGPVILDHFSSTQLTVSVVQDQLRLKWHCVGSSRAWFVVLLMGLNSGVSSRVGKALVITHVAFPHFSRLFLHK